MNTNETNTTNKIYRQLQQSNMPKELRDEDLAGLKAFLRGKVSQQTEEQFGVVMKHGNAAEIMKWCLRQKDPGPWLVLAATAVPCIAEQPIIKPHPNKLHPGQSFFNGSPFSIGNTKPENIPVKG